LAEQKINTQASDSNRRNGMSIEFVAAVSIPTNKILTVAQLKYPKQGRITALKNRRDQKKIRE
jgi:hypothetical protein